MAGSTSGDYLYTFPCSLGVETHVVNFSAWCVDHDAFAKEMRSVTLVCALRSCSLTFIVSSSFMLRSMVSRWSRSLIAGSKWSLEWWNQPWFVVFVVVATLAACRIESLKLVYVCSFVIFSLNLRLNSMLVSASPLIFFLSIILFIFSFTLNLIAVILKLTITAIKFKVKEKINKIIDWKKN